MDPTKLKYIVERAAQDEQLEQLERLQRGELTQGEAEALRTAKAPDAEVLYELYRPLDDLEKQRVLRAARSQTQGDSKTQTRRRGIAGAVSLVAMAAGLGIVSMQWAGQTEPAQLVAVSESVQSENGHDMLGAAEKPTQRTARLGGCLSVALVAAEPEGRLKPDTQALLFLQNQRELVRWPVELRYSEKTGGLTATQSCVPLPSSGLSAGSWKLVSVYGSSLPPVQQAESVLRGASKPLFARWKIASADVKLQPAAKQ